MGIAVDDAVACEWPPPRLEQGRCDGVARLERRAFEFTEGASFKPCHGEKAFRRELRQRDWNRDVVVLFNHRAIEPHMSRFPLVVEFFGKTCGNFLADLA